MHDRPRTPFRRTVLIASLLLTVLGCPREEAPPEWKAALETVPPVLRLEELDVPVRHQYELVRNEVDELLRNPAADPADLGLAYGKLGMWHQVYVFPEVAVICYRNAERLAPKDVRWPYYLGMLFLNSSVDDARAAFERALALVPNDAAILIHLGETELAAGAVEKADAHFRAALAVEPSNPGALAGLGSTAVSRKDYAEAVTHLERVLAMQPNASKLHQLLGLAYRGLGDTRRAQEHLSQVASDINNQVPLAWPDARMEALDGMADSARIHTRRAKAALKRGDRETAGRAFELAMQARPDDAGLRSAYARFLLDGGQTSEAVIHAGRAAKAKPTDPTVRALYGRALSESGDLDAAESELREAIRLDARLHEAWTRLAGVETKRQRHEEALKALEEAVRLDPTTLRTRAQRAVALLRLGRYEEARKRIDEDLALDAQYRPLRLLLARVLAASPDEKLRDPKRSLELALALLGDLDRKIENVEEIVANAVSIQEAETVAMAEAANGRFDRALAWQRAAREAVEKAFPGKGAPWITDRLTAYEQRQPCRVPLDEREALLARVYVTVPSLR